MFLALSLPDAVRSALAGLARPLPGVIWTRPEQLHLTLRFLGDVPVRSTESMIQHLEAVDVASFILPIEGIGSFPPGRPPRTVWAGIGTGHPRLFQLRQRMDDALLRTGLPLDLRTFQPHVTLARCTENAGPALEQWLHENRELAAPPFRVTCFDLYTSALRPAGSVHTLRRRFLLRPVFAS